MRDGKKMEHPLVLAIAKGLTISLAVLMVILAVTFFTFVFVLSVWWLVGVVLATSVGGTLFGIHVYLLDNY